MRVEALGYRAAHAVHQQVMCSSLYDEQSRGHFNPPLRFVPRPHCQSGACARLCMAWPVSAHLEAPSLFDWFLGVGLLLLRV